MLSYIVWSQSPEIFTYGSFSIRWYGVLFAVGFLVGQQIMMRMYKIEGKPLADIESLMMYIVISTVLGARLGHCLFYEPDYYLAHPLDILKVWEGGLASHGATVAILFAVWLFSRKHPDQSYLWVLDRLVIVVALSGALIRFGNLMNSEIIGKPTDVPWAFIFTAVDYLPRHPAQLYESLSCVALFLFLLWVYSRYKAALPEGRIFGLFLIILFSLRFFYEFLKENQVDFENNLALNMGQILSIPLVLIGVYVLWRSFVIEMKQQKTEILDEKEK